MVQHNAATGTRADTSYKTDLVGKGPKVPSPRSANTQNDVVSFMAEESTSAANEKTTIRGESSSNVKIRKYPAHPRGSGSLGKVRKALQNQEQAKTNTLRNRAIRKIYQANRREQTQSWIPDWRVILEQLRKHTSQNDEWLEKAVYISVPDNAVEQLFNGVDDNMWDIADRYNCSVELANRRSDKGRYNEFLISGPATAISKTAADIVRLAPDAMLKAGPQALLSRGSNPANSLASIDSEEELDSSVGLRLVSSQRRRMLFGVRPEELSKPLQWTARTFADFVTDLTSIKMPNHLHKLLYKEKKGHIHAVVEILREIFSNPDYRSSMSRTAFNQAMAFYVKTMHIPDARAAFVLMEMMEIPTNPETFNILLRGAAKQQDLHVFQFILHLMQRRGVMPNGQTWIAFLMANYDLNIKTHIVAAMKDKGLLFHTSTLKGVCEQLIVREVNASLDLGQSQDDFLRHMDSRYGPRWLSADSGNRVLYALGARSLISRCWEFLRAMSARHIKPDQVSINTILNHCKQTANVSGAIEIMESLPSLFHFVPGEHTYHTLFELAWRSRSYNLARVVWKYACLNAGTTRRMRLLVRQSLLTAYEHSTNDLTQYAIWKRQAGLVITSNADDHPTSHSPKLPVPESHCELELEGQGALDKQGRSQLRQDVDVILERDQQVLLSWVPTRPFGEMLREAWERDYQWGKVRVEAGGERLDWKLQRAIAVPVRSRPSQGSHALESE